jgi:plasmid stabilization system protein ParE
LNRKRQSRRTSVVLTLRALHDLQEIERFSITRWGRKTAARYLQHISSALDRLSQNPTLLSIESGAAPGLSFYRVQKHVLVCDHRIRRIVVLTIVHSSMDLPARLAELEPQLFAEVEFLHARLEGPTHGD